jgi:hypothetical protein
MIHSGNLPLVWPCDEFDVPQVVQVVNVVSEREELLVADVHLFLRLLCPISGGRHT